MWLPGGMCGCQGVCMVLGEHAWLPGGAVHGSGGHMWFWGVCMVAGGCAWLPGGPA